jgi:diguanylate cyclase (GGDEF)-like protein
MPLDYNSLLLAIGFAGAGLAVTTFASWLTARADRFLLTWAIGIALIVAHVLTYSSHVSDPQPLLQVVAFALLLSGLSLLFGAALQFRRREMPWRTVLAVALGCIVALVPPALLGLDGLVYIVANLAAGTLMAVTAYQYWIGRDEAPTAIWAISVLYLVTGLSFLPCAILPAISGQWVIGHAPENWTEDLNAFGAIVGLTGIGALSLALNQTRLARGHSHDALTDALSGLMNRRALFNQFGGVPVDRNTAVLLFDIDRFKTVNDEFGHAVGDDVIRRFAEILTECLRGNDTCARIGGEEFAAVLARTTTDKAHQIAERIRKTFAELVVETEKGSLQCTVSIGIAFPTTDLPSFDEVLRDADKALYRAKNGGRNRVATATLRLAG